MTLDEFSHFVLQLYECAARSVLLLIGVENGGRGQGVTSAHSNPWAYLNALTAQCARQTRLQGRACGSCLPCADRYHLFFASPWSVWILTSLHLDFITCAVRFGGRMRRVLPDAGNYSS